MRGARIGQETVYLRLGKVHNVILVELPDLAALCVTGLLPLEAPVPVQIESLDGIPSAPEGPVEHGNGVENGIVHPALPQAPVERPEGEETHETLENGYHRITLLKSVMGSSGAPLDRFVRGCPGDAQ